MECEGCGAVFHFARDQVRVKCSECGKVQVAVIAETDMTADDRQLLRDRQCGDKRRFETAEEASHVRIAYETAHLCEMRQYLCEFCGYIHIGHKPSDKRRRQNAVSPTVPEIDNSLTDEEARAEMAFLKVAVAEGRRDLASTPLYDPKRQTVKVRMLSNEARLMKLQVRYGKLPVAKPKPADTPKRDVPTSYFELSTDDLLNVFFEAAREIGQRLRRAEPPVAAGRGE
jgi:predicted  nucleic acid-binding Zn-ribbon protein